MASLGRIDDIVADKAQLQLDQLVDKLNASNQALLNNINSAAQLNAIVGNSGSLKELNTNIEKQAKALVNVSAATDKARLSEIQLQKAREKAFDDYEKKLAKQQSEITKAAQNTEKVRERERASSLKTQQQREKEAARAEALAKKQAEAQEKLNKKIAEAELPYNKLKKALADAEKEAANIGATFGAASPEFASAAKNVQEVRKQVNAIEQPLGKFQRNVGNYAQTAFNGIKTIANILPGLGLSGAFLAIFTGFQQLYELFAVKGFNATAALNELNKKSNDIYAEQATNVKLLYAEVRNGNLSQERTAEIIKELNTVSPKYFGNIKNQQDLIKQLPADYARYNEALLLNSRIEAAKSLITDEYKKQLEAQRKQISANTREQELQGKATTDFGKTINSLYNIASGGFNLSIIDAKQIKDATNEISRSQKAINFLTGDLLKNQQLLQKNGGSILGGDKELLSNESKAAIEQQKVLLTRQTDFNRSIADDTKRSYASRRIAEKAFYEDQQQLIKLNETQQLMDTKLTSTERSNIVYKTTSDLLNAEREYNKSIKELNSNASKDRSAAIDSDLEKRKEAARRVFDNENINAKTRFEAVGVFERTSRRLINNSYELQIQDAGDNADKVKKLNSDREKEITSIAIESREVREKIQLDINKKYEELYKQRIKSLTDSEKAQVLAIQNSSNEKLQVIDSEINEQKQALAKQLQDGLITSTDYNTKLFGIEQSAAAKRVEVQIAAIKQVIDAQAVALATGIGSAEDLQKSTEALTKLQNDAEQLKLKVVLDSVKQREQAIRDLHKLEADLAYQSLDLIVAITKASSEKQNEQLDEQASAIDKQAERDKKNVDNSLLTAEQKADAEALIDAQATSQKEAIAGKQKQIAKDQADYEKAISLLKIGVKTGETVFDLTATAAQATAQGALLLANPLTAAYAPIAFAAAAAIGAQIPFVIASGIAQAAAVALVPGFWKGTDNAPGGAAWVGERGTELLIDPQGRTALTPNGPTLTYLQPGTQVFTHEKTLNMLRRPEKLQASGGSFDFNQWSRMQAQHTSQIVKAVGQKSPTTVITKGGWRKTQGQNIARSQYENRYFK